MSFSAARLVESWRAWTLKIGDQSWVPRPLSVVDVLRCEVLLTSPDPLKAAAATLHALRAAFPVPSWWRRWGWSDPVPIVLQLAPAVRTEVLRALLVGPRVEVEPDADPDDELAQIAAMQRGLLAQRASAQGPTLALIVATLRREYGEAWYYDPRRYPTVDGYVPARTAVIDYAGYQALRAQRLLDEAYAARLGSSDAREWTRQTARLQRAAFPDRE